MKKTLTAALIAGMSMMAMPAAASTVVANGGTVCESLGPSTFTAASVGGCDATFGDLANSAPGEDLTFEGAGDLFGFVADRRGTRTTLFPDFAQITFETKSLVTFELFNTDSAFDAVVSLAGVSVLLDAANTVATFVVEAGQTQFSIETASNGAINSATRNGSDYNLNVAPVPLPAAGWLLLAGIGGLGVMRRRKSAS